MSRSTVTWSITPEEGPPDTEPWKHSSSPGAGPPDGEPWKMDPGAGPPDSEPW